MSKRKRQAKSRTRTRWWKAFEQTLPSTAGQLLSYEQHLKDHPMCTVGPKIPHFVPPSFGEIGYYTCDIPADTRNHTRCRAPYDHEHSDHQDVEILIERINAADGNVPAGQAAP